MHFTLEVRSSNQPHDLERLATALAEAELVVGEFRFSRIGRHEITVCDVKTAPLKREDAAVLPRGNDTAADAAGLQRLLSTVLGPDCDIVLSPGDRRACGEAAAAPTLVLTAIMSSCASSDLGRLFGAVTRAGARFQQVYQLATPSPGADMRCIEAQIVPPAACSVRELREQLLSDMAPLPMDIALQPASLLRRSKRLLLMDMDSTLIQMEVIDALAEVHGVGEEVRAVTEAAMRGDLPFEQSLTQRVALLAGLEASALGRLADALPLTPGAERLVRVLKVLGYRLGIVSGGFTFAAERLKAQLGLDYAFANTLEVAEGKLTGRVLAPIITPERKADLLEVVAQQEHIRLAQTVAVGDGANDLLMLQRAGLGIAFHAKPRLKAAADTALSSGGLDRILYFLGLRDEDIQALDAGSQDLLSHT